MPAASWSTVVLGASSRPRPTSSRRDVPMAWPKVAALATLPSVNPTIGAALIALAGAVIGVGNYIGSRLITARTIEADRRVRIWEKRSEVYTDAAAGILQLVEVRYSQLHHNTTRTAEAPERAPQAPAGASPCPVRGCGVLVRLSCGVWPGERRCWRACRS